MGSAVQNSDDLAVSLDRHSPDRSFCRDFEEFDSHLPGQLAAAGREPRLQFGVKVVEYSHSAILPSAALGRLKP